MAERTYSELIQLPTIIERFDYLKLGGKIGFKTFGKDRWLNQHFYHLKEWLSIKRGIIARDQGFEFGLDGYPIKGFVIVHHLNPITKEQILDRDPWILDPENLISVSDLVHKAVHYGNAGLLPQDYIPRQPFDTCPWRTR